LSVLAIEAAIAAFVHGGFVRCYLGDALAVVGVYLVARAATPLSMWCAAVAALAVGFGIEFGQLFGLLNALGLGRNRLARLVLGGGFDPLDFVAYAAGAGAALLIDRIRWSSSRRKTEHE
jgi:hypothetical protein